MEKSYRALNDVLVNLFNDIMDIEQDAIITGEFCDITNNDMHIIEAVGVDQPMNMSSIAKKMLVTMGTLTISMNSLVKKGYVMRERSEEDRRVVFIRLTEKGKRAYYHHEAFHREMIEAVVKGLAEDEKEILVTSLTQLKDFFMNYKKKHKNS
ncbi:MarR family winged helix-turn-helix transcriptional regulator [Ruminococcus gauvreauii]|uniref:MarR family transcriptional regulator n=1 Tax=Ruminococcus gauvreauii TaxID=438033 RepID=A0ABY5VBX9_9FIRM|nr:MarR family transcriptional regulator [Ruminococcus gauvreauii]UWP58059.1 MarR family transcriptional regulator [Ruminococcus gauvreauii]